MIKKFFFDTETAGFHGPIVLFQYAIDDSEINLWSPWLHRVKDTIDLYESMLDTCVIGFNLTFDAFHVYQQWTTLQLFKDKNIIPIDRIDEYAILEKQARDYDKVFKPRHVFDIMLHARKGKYQATLDRDDVRIKRVPTALAFELAKELDNRIKFPDIYFARKSDKKIRWQVFDIVDKELGTKSRDFKDVVIKFAPSSALKALAVDVGLVTDEEKLLIADVGVSKSFMPIEHGYSPFALAPYTDKEGITHHPKPGDWKRKWPDYIKLHIEHWAYNDLAQTYARDDVYYTRGLYNHFGIQESDWSDDDSVLAWMVGNVRWKGYRIDIEEVKKLRIEAEEKRRKSPHNFLSSAVARRYVTAVMTPMEKAVISIDGKATTKGTILEHITKWTKDPTVCEKCNGQGCQYCDEGMVDSGIPHEAAIRAREVLDQRRAKKREEVLKKLEQADRFHADSNIIGARSSRMSGAGGLNAQGIDRDKRVRFCFKFAWPGQKLNGGDLEGSQIAIAAAIYGDENLGNDLKTIRPCAKCEATGKVDGKNCPICDGHGEHKQKLYGLFGECLFAPMTYDEIIKTAKSPGDADKYDRSKKSVLALIFGAEAFTLSTKVGVTEDAANEGYQRFISRYPGVGRSRQKYTQLFCSMRQPNGLGTKVEWHEPAEYIEALYGFKRFYTLENKVCKELFNLAEKPPKSWTQMKIKVVRRDREQLVAGAVRSALFAAAFAIQASNMRSACNHVVQSPEAILIKKLQRKIWNIQPSGIADWHVSILNIHDELIGGAKPELSEKIKSTVDTFIEECRKDIPLIGMDWHDDLKDWSEK